MKRRGIFSRMFGGVKNYSYKISGMRLLKPCAYYITDSISDFSKALNQRYAERSYEEAVAEYGLTEQDLAKKCRSLLWQCVFYLALGLGIFFYASFNVTKFSILVVFNYYLVAMVLFAFAFRMHFYRYLLSQKNLSLTYRDWLKAVCNGDV